ncbi:unnamed protein product [Rhodiola kirilowii]
MFGGLFTRGEHFFSMTQRFKIEANSKFKSPNSFSVSSKFLPLVSAGNRKNTNSHTTRHSPRQERLQTGRMSSSYDEGEIVPHAVLNYHFVDGNVMNLFHLPSCPCDE